MNSVTLYDVDVPKKTWRYIVSELCLPEDTEEITFKSIEHITKQEVKDRNLPKPIPIARGTRANK